MKNSLLNINLAKLSLVVFMIFHACGEKKKLIPRSPQAHKAPEIPMSPEIPTAIKKIEVPEKVQALKPSPCGWNTKWSLNFTPFEPVLPGINSLGKDLLLSWPDKETVLVQGENGATAGLRIKNLPLISGGREPDSSNSPDVQPLFYRWNAEVHWIWDTNGIQFGKNDLTSNSVIYNSINIKQLEKNIESKVLLANERQFVIMAKEKIFVIFADGKMRVKEISREKGSPLSEVINSIQISDDLKSMFTLTHESQKSGQLENHARFWVEKNGQFEPECDAILVWKKAESSPPPALSMHMESSVAKTARFALVGSQGVSIAGVNVLDGTDFNIQNPDVSSPSKESQSLATWKTVEPVVQKSCATANCHARPGATRLLEQADWIAKKDSILGQIKSDSMPPPGSAERNNMSSDEKDILVRFLERPTNEGP